MFAYNVKITYRPFIFKCLTFRVNRIKKQVFYTLKKYIFPSTNPP